MSPRSRSSESAHSPQGPQKVRNSASIGLIGAPLLLASDIAIFFGVIDRVSPFAAVAFIPIAVWELSLGVYLTAKGFKPAAVAALPSTQPVR